MWSSTNDVKQFLTSTPRNVALFIIIALLLSSQNPRPPTPKSVSYLRIRVFIFQSKTKKWLLQWRVSVGCLRVYIPLVAISILLSIQNYWREIIFQWQSRDTFNKPCLPYNIVPWKTIFKLLSLINNLCWKMIPVKSWSNFHKKLWIIELYY